MKTVSLLLILAAFFTFFNCENAELKLAQQNKAIVTKAFEVVGNGDFDQMGNYIAENYVRHSQATPGLVVESLDDFKAFIRQDRLAIPDQILEIKNLVAEGNMVAFYAIYKGTQAGQMGPFPPSGKTTSLEFAGIHRMENGKIAETWITWDNITILSQLGHFAPAAPAIEDGEISE
jgi:steroid delta-isomerase-like uncharacterized protein